MNKTKNYFPKVMSHIAAYIQKFKGKTNSQNKTKLIPQLEAKSSEQKILVYKHCFDV